MGKLTIKVKKVAYYNNGLVYPNEIIKNYKGDTVPSWATLANGKEQKKDETPVNPQTPSQTQTPDNPVKPEGKGEENSGGKEPDGEVIVAGDGGVHIASEEKTDLQLQEELDALLDESVAKGIILDNAENKTLDEQIAELKTLLGKE